MRLSNLRRLHQIYPFLTQDISRYTQHLRRSPMHLVQQLTLTPCAMSGRKQPYSLVMGRPPKCSTKHCIWQKSSHIDIWKISFHFHVFSFFMNGVDTILYPMYRLAASPCHIPDAELHHHIHGDWFIIATTDILYTGNKAGSCLSEYTIALLLVHRVGIIQMLPSKLKQL